MTTLKSASLESYFHKTININTSYYNFECMLLLNKQDFFRYGFQQLLSPKQHLKFEIYWIRGCVVFKMLNIIIFSATLEWQPIEWFNP